MQEHAADQIASIHAMMSSGHRSVLMERHSLWLWGITAAALILTVRYVLTPDLFAISWHHTLASNVYIALVLIAISIVDLRWTHQARESRDETLSFIQVQLTKVWWLILGLIVLINIGMNIFGGGILFYPILLSLIGLAFYIQGLFSRQMLSWTGIIMILLGLACAAVGLPLLTQEWLAIVVFGLGLPTLGLFIHRTHNVHNRFQQPVFFLSWVGLMLLTAFTITQWRMSTESIELPLVMLNEFKSTTAKPIPDQIVRIPKGTVVPVEVSIEGDVLNGKNTATAPLQLADDFDVVLIDGKPDGHFRGAEGKWKQRRLYYRLRNFNLRTEVLPETGPKIKLSFYISTEGK